MSRKSEQRDFILKTVKSTAIHPDANWIYQRVKAEIPNISLGTIYRNLKLMAEKGYINQLDFADGPSRFDGRTDIHQHLKCLKCGRIMDIDFSLNITAVDKIEMEYNFEIKGYNVIFYGLCSMCRNKTL